MIRKSEMWTSFLLLKQLDDENTTIKRFSTMRQKFFTCIFCSFCIYFLFRVGSQINDMPVNFHGKISARRLLNVCSILWTMVSKITPFDKLRTLAETFEEKWIHISMKYSLTNLLNWPASISKGMSDAEFNFRSSLVIMMSCWSKREKNIDEFKKALADHSLCLSLMNLRTN